MTWNPFSKNTKDGQATQSVVESREEAGETGKGRPTPRRKTAEERNLRPLVPKDRKASLKQARARAKQREDAEYLAMRTGDTAHMPKAERLPWRVYIRDYVDARFNIGEFFIPFSFAILICLFVITAAFPQRGPLLMVVMYAYLIAVIIDVAIMWHRLKKKLIAKFGDRSVARGTRSGSYAWTRSIQMRRWRLPKPRYKKRGQWPQ